MVSPGVSKITHRKLNYASNSGSVRLVSTHNHCSLESTLLITIYRDIIFLFADIMLDVPM